MYRASHILIAYQGAQRATSQRIQEEALFEAGRVQQEILSCLLYTSTLPTSHCG